MAVQLSDWYDELAVYAPGATLAGMQQAVEKTVEALFRDSGAYAKVLPGIVLHQGRFEYQIPAQPEGPILYLYGFTYGGTPVRPCMDERWSLLDRTATASTPSLVRGIVDKPGAFVIWPTPSSDPLEPIVPTVAFGYDPECREFLPVILKTQWYDVVLSGALSRLCAQPNKPFSDAALAVFHGKRFRNGIAVARDSARKQFMRQETGWCFPAWA